MSEKWLSVQELADHMGVSKDSIYNYIKKGMPARKIGKPWKYVIIPHNAVLANMSFETLVKKYAYGQGV